MKIITFTRSFRGDVSSASHGGSVCEHDVSFLLAPQCQSHAPQDVRFQATWDERAMNDLKRTTLDKINLKHLVLIGNVHEKIWEWMAISTRYLYAPPSPMSAITDLQTSARPARLPWTRH